MPSTRIRITDIARHIGVSPATVSAVLNNKTIEARISEEMSKAVWQAAQELGYQPNIAARRLRNSEGTSGTLYLAVVSSLETPLTIVGTVFQGVQSFVQRAELPIQLTVETFRRNELQQLPGLLDGSRFNGALIANTGPKDDAFLAATTLPTPIVLMLRRIDQHSYVTHDGSASGRQAAELFLRLGRRRCAVLTTGDTTQARQERLQGFLDVLARQPGASAEPLVITAERFSEQGGYDAMQTFLGSGQRCDALFTVGDILAFGAMAAIRSNGLRIPDDIALVGHDDQEMARFVDPPLTTFHVPLRDMAIDAAQMLVELLSGRQAEPLHRLYPGTLIQRGSTTPVA